MMIFLYVLIGSIIGVAFYVQGLEEIESKKDKEKLIGTSVFIGLMFPALLFILAVLGVMLLFAKIACKIQGERK